MSSKDEDELQNYGFSIIQAINSGDYIAQNLIEEKIDSCVARLFKLSDEEISVIKN